MQHPAEAGISANLELGKGQIVAAVVASVRQKVDSLWARTVRVVFEADLVFQSATITTPGRNGYFGPGET